MPTFYPAFYFGGPIYSLLGLCNALARMQDLELRVLTTDSSGPRRDDRLSIREFTAHPVLDYKVDYCPKWWGKDFSGSMLAKLFRAIRWADVVHLTSAYSFSTLPTLFICRLMQKPVVWSPRGALQRWEGSTRPLLKRAWESICNILLNPKRTVLHLTSEDEAEESRQRITRAQIEIIGNGVEMPAALEGRVWRPNNQLRLLYIGRLHPKKGIENLLQAMNIGNNKVMLNICGAGEPDYENSLKTIARTLGLDERVRFSGHVEGAQKFNAFQHADVCIVPSFTENFAMVVAEALAHGIPVIASRGTPWKELVHYDCGAWVENDPASLARAIEKIQYQNLEKMGQNGREWMQKSFSWSAVAAKTYSVYDILTHTKI